MGPLSLKYLAFALLTGACTCAALFADDAAARLRSRERALLVAFAIAGALAAFGHQVRIALALVPHPPHWDFEAFYLFGHVALGSHGVYDAGAFEAALLRYGTPDAVADPSFHSELVGVGLPYPPFTVPLFAGLGLFANYHAAAAVWYAMLLIVALAAAAAFARTFLSSRGVLGFALAAIVLGVSHGALEDLSVAQTIPLAMLATFSAFAYRRAEGYWLALAIVVKPFTGVLLGVALLMRRTGAVSRAIVALALALGAGVAIIGPAAAGRYLTAGPIARVPPSMFMESINSSLSAVVLRTLHPVLPDRLTPAMWLPYDVAAAALGLVTAFAVWRACARGADDVAAALALVGGLLIFPGTLPYYTALALAPIGVAWRRRGELPGGAAGVACGAGLFEMLLGTDAGDVTFVTLLLAWSACLAWALQPLEPRVRAREDSLSTMKPGVLAC